MANPYQTQEFRQLQEELYSKLRDSGFKDIEDDRGRLVDHKSVSDLKQRKFFQPEVMDITLSYYSWAGEMLHSGTFKCDRDKIIWTYHCEGMTGTEIALRIGFKNRKWVNRVIQKIKNYLK